MAQTDLAELVIAYRKAKVDLYFSTDPRLVDLVEYEENLESRLSDLLARINGEDEEWVSDPSFVGTFTFFPKQMVPNDSYGSDSFFWSDPAQSWRESAGRGRATGEFRLMSKCSINMHVLSTLWMLRVGGKLESTLNGVAMGNRMRRNRDGSVNRLAAGSFQQYLGPYRRWRDGGLNAMETALSAGKSVVALTADATSYYHNLSPTFLLNHDYLQSTLGVILSEDELKIHRLFVNSILGWTSSVGRYLKVDARGLPVGLPASAVVANLALVEFDRLAIEEFKPIYYGRYVDDVIIVLEGAENLTSPRRVWDWLIQRSRGMLTRTSSQSGHGEERVSIRFSAEYLEDSAVIFDNDKNKIYHLSGPTGEYMVASIKRTIDERSSEWRALPSVPGTASKIGADIAVVTNSSGENADTLRDADKVSAKRAGFAIRLRDFEAYERDLDSRDWAEHRTAFYETVCKQVLVLPTFFDLAPYVARLIKLAAACTDLRALAGVFTALAGVYTETLQTCNLSVRAYPGVDPRIIASRWASWILNEVFESLSSGLVSEVAVADFSAMIRPLSRITSFAEMKVLDVGRIRQLHSQLFLRDLAHVPYRYCLYPRDIAPAHARLNGSRKRDARYLTMPLDDDLRIGLDALTSSDRQFRSEAGEAHSGSEIAGLLFATRPPSMLELSLALRGRDNTPLGVASTKVIQQILFSMRGYQLSDKVVEVDLGKDSTSYPVIRVRSKMGSGRKRIALGMVNTEMESFKAAALGNHELSRERYEILNSLLNDVIKNPAGADYLLMPESTIPPMWFVHFATKLHQRGIDLISGVEYRSGGERIVHNQVWAALSTDGGGFPAQIMYAQDKQLAAPGEERTLHEIAQLKMVPEVKWGDPWSRPPVIVHGDFRFALLICSELTNIQSRASLRGRIDALFVPEWNQDLHTFSALVESAALDIHAYIAQSNNRMHGDSRIRAPRTKDWEREIVRVRGGTHDYFVVGEIDYWSLREHQSAHRVYKGEFKPVPDGFTMSQERKRSPKLSKG